MKACIISDGEYQTETFQNLNRTIAGYFAEKGFETVKMQVEIGDLAFCKGCFNCWVKKPGECVIGDDISRINRTAMNSDVVLLLCPVVFGQFSANMKSVVDRWLPNMLPFFKTRPDGSTMHPPRYDDYPKQIMIGFADDLSAEDMVLFSDITKKHRTNVDVLFWMDSESDTRRELDAIRLERAGGQL